MCMHVYIFIAIAFAPSSEQYLEPAGLFAVNENPFKKVLLYLNQSTPCRYEKEAAKY